MSLCGQSDQPDPLARLVRRIFAAALPRRKQREMAAAVETDLDLCRVQAEPLSHDEAVAFVTSGDCGAIATFLGTTRNNFDGRPVRTLMYEAYAPMAESKMREILREARRAYGVRKACALHRVGEVKIGEASVVLAFASPHRKDALNACAWAIDELKRVVPVWKQEVYADEDASWKANKEWDPAGLARDIRAPPAAATSPNGARIPARPSQRRACLAVSSLLERNRLCLCHSELGQLHLGSSSAKCCQQESCSLFSQE